MNSQQQFVLDKLLPKFLQENVYYEINDEKLRSNISKNVRSIVKSVYTYCRVECDETINTPIVIDNCQFKIKITYGDDLPDTWIYDEDRLQKDYGWKTRIYTIAFTDTTFEELLN